VSLSLLETTAICRELTGSDLEVGSVAETRQGDVPVYLSDCAALYSHTTWRPRRGVRDILTDIHEWVVVNEALVLGALG